MTSIAEPDRLNFRMCGRFTLRTPARDLVEVFELIREPELSSRYNIARTQHVAVIRHDGKTRQLSLMRWGLVPAWSKDPKAGPPRINARSETVATKPSFMRAAIIPRAIAVERARFDGHTNSHILFLRNDVWNAPNVRDVTAGLCAVTL